MLFTIHPLLCMALLFFALSMVGAWVAKILRIEESNSILHPLFGWAAYIFLGLQ